MDRDSIKLFINGGLFIAIIASLQYYFSTRPYTPKHPVQIEAPSQPLIMQSAPQPKPAAQPDTTWYAVRDRDTLGEIAYEQYRLRGGEIYTQGVAELQTLNDLTTGDVYLRDNQGNLIPGRDSWVDEHPKLVPGNRLILNIKPALENRL